MSKYKLSVGGVFKNEAHSIKEWIDHYLFHGADHFYLINDGSTDNTLSIARMLEKKFSEVRVLDKKNSGNSKSNSPTLDRIDNNKGYVKGNVKVISHRANSLKSSGTILEFTKIIEYIESGLQEKF